MNFQCTTEDTVVATEQGKYRGYQFRDIYQFRGIPYAKAERFRPPEEPDSFEGVRDALHYGSVCPLMFPDRADGDVMSPHRVWFPDENCQNLNIWTPSLQAENRLPVIVWFHGGGFFAGSSIEQYAYDGESLAGYGPAVIVTVNHRLNVLGYLDLRGFDDKYERSCNAGNLDLVAALQWIHRNIAGFGGDPDNVTIFGQSGGGGKVISLMQMPQADGLFHKAMIMSGTLGEVLTDHTVDMKPVIRRTMANLEIAEEEIDRLQTIPYEKLVEAYLEAYGALITDRGIPFFGPHANVDYVGDPMKVGFTEHAKTIPVIIGSVFSEFYSSSYRKEHVPDEKIQEIIVEKYGEEKGTALVAAFRKAYPEKVLADLFAIDGGAFRYESKKWARERVKQGCADTWLYLFDLDFPAFGGTPAWHCSDIPYFFHNLDKTPIVNIEEVSDRLCEQMSGAFMEFARTGRPVSPLLPEWEPCEEGHEKTMFFDKSPVLRENVDDEILDLCRELKINGSFI